MIAAGVGLWVALGAAWAVGVVELDVVRFMLALALLVVVPLGTALHRDAPSAAPLSSLAVGLLAAVGLLTSQRGTGAALVAPALANAVWIAFVSGVAWWGTGRHVLDLGWLASAGYLVVGAAWLLLDRLGVEPVGVREPFVMLTAVHFHYAGFAAALIASLLRRRLRGSRTAVVGAVLVVVAPPIVAAGFTLLGVLQIVGAVVLTAGLFTVAVVTLARVVPAEAGMGRWLLVVSSVAVFAPMVLAVQWAVGWNYGTPALSIPAMARTHGVVNALAFTLCGLLGWRAVSQAARR